VPILHFKGKVLPYAPNHYRVDANEIPTVEWVDQAAQQTYKISTKLENSVIDIEFEMQAFSGADQLASMAIRAWDLARLVVDLISFQQGWGLSVILDTLVMPAGLTSWTVLSSLCLMRRSPRRNCWIARRCWLRCSCGE